MIHENIMQTIGRTPLIRTSNQRILAKLERFNPTGSLKDRVVLEMIENAEQDQLLKGREVLVEATSGNTGVALAMIGKRKGYSVTIVMPENMSQERKKMIKAFGAKLVLTPKQKGETGAMEKARELSKRQNHINLNQFDNPANKKAHHKTAEEIWQDTKGKVTHFIAAMGTTGTITGVSEKLKKHDPKIKTIGVSPQKNHNIQGLMNLEEERAPTIMDETVIDEIIEIKDKTAFHYARKLALEEGFFVGASSGAAFSVANRIAKKEKDAFIVVLMADGGEKYFSTELFH